MIYIQTLLSFLMSSKNPYLMSEQAQKWSVAMPRWMEPITLDYRHEENDFCFMRAYERPYNVALTCLRYWISKDNAVKNSSLAKEQHLSCACLTSGIMTLYHRMLWVPFFSPFFFPFSDNCNIWDRAVMKCSAGDRVRWAFAILLNLFLIMSDVDSRLDQERL